MRRVLFLIMLAVFPVLLMAQFKLTETGFHTEEGGDYIVKEYKGMSSHDIFNGILTNINNQFNSGENVVSKVDDQSISLDGIGELVIAKGGFGNKLNGNIKFKISFSFKPGKVKIDAPYIKEMYRYANGKILNTYISKDYDGKEGSGLLGDQYIFKNGKLKKEDIKNNIELWFNDLVVSLLDIKSNNDW